MELRDQVALEAMKVMMEGTYSRTLSAVRSITCNKCLMVGVLPPKPTVDAGVVYYCPNCGEPVGHEFTGERIDG